MNMNANASASDRVGASQPTPAPGPQGNGNQAARLLRPEQIQGLRLDETIKQKYTEALTKMWKALESADPSSQQYKQIFANLQKASQQIRQQYMAQQAGQRPMNPQGPPAQGGGQTQQPGQNIQPPQQAGPRPPTQPQQRPTPAAIIEKVNSMAWIAPGGVQPGTAEAQQRINQLKQQYVQAATMEAHMGDQLQKYKAAQENLAKQGKQLPLEQQNQGQEIRKRFVNATALMKRIMDEQESLRKTQQAAAGQQPPHTTQAGAAVNAPTPQDFKLQIPPQTRHDSPPQSATLPPSNTQQPRGPQSPTMNQNQQMPPSQPATFPPQQPGQLAGASPVTSGPSFVNGQRPQFPQQGQFAPGQLPPGQQQAQQPQSAGPQGNSANGAQTLSHAAALAQSQAARAGFPNQQNAPQSATSQGPPPATGQPPSAYPGQNASRPDGQMNTNPKMPIPRTLDVARPVPVSMGPSRPTMGGPGNGPGAPGVMGQPVIPKPPAPSGFTLEGEAGRVLSKKKLDELVRQVTGAEGSGQGLTAEVEEAMLQIADDFIDEVITAACRLAKMRESATLDIRDIQIILERNYNIRIPGYATDEVRTVKKFHPAPGWTAKMNAVQAAKVMGGKTDI